MSDLIKVLVTGSNGQLGNELKNLASINPEIQFEFTDIDELDITSLDEIEECYKENNFHYCVNCAAYTAVDKAEEDKKLATLVNAIAAEYLSKTAASHGVKYIHISTDFVYSGDNNRPYLEEDKTKPLSEYGRTKLLGENLALENNINSIIIRTSWLYSTFGDNFVKTMLRLSESKSELNVIYDQIGTPTYAKDLAEVIIQIIETGKFETGIYHYSNEGVASWYDFAKTIFEEKKINIKVNPISTEVYSTPAKRPPYSVMSKEKIKNRYGLEIPYWRDSLKKCLNKL